MNAVEVQVMRIFSTYGPRNLPKDGGVASNFIVQWLRGGRPNPHGERKQTQSLSYVDNLVEGMIWLICGKHVGLIDIDNLYELSIRQPGELIRTRIRPVWPLIKERFPKDDTIQYRASSLAWNQPDWQPDVMPNQNLDSTVEDFKGASRSLRWLRFTGYSDFSFELSKNTELG